MCVLEHLEAGPAELRRVFSVTSRFDFLGNLEPVNKYPRRSGPVIRLNENGEREALLMEWGHPYHRWETVSGRRQVALKKNGEPYAPKPTVNIRNPHYPMFRNYLEPKYRCLVPTNRFAEPNPKGKEEGQPKNIWFSMTEETETFAFAGIWRPWERRWSSEERECASEVYAFLTCDPNELIKPIHPKAMPVILDKKNWEDWLTAPWVEAKGLQKPFDKDKLKVYTPSD